MRGLGVTFLLIAAALQSHAAAAQTACPEQPKQRLMSAILTSGVDPRIGMASLPIHGVQPVPSQNDRGAVYALAPARGPFWLFCFYAKPRHRFPDTSLSLKLPPQDTLCRRDTAHKLLCAGS